MTPANDWCQRWTADRACRWRHVASEPINPRAYAVEPLSEPLARAFVESRHYSGTYPADRLRYGLWRGPELVGAAVLSVPAQAAVLSIPFPQLQPYVESLELGRFVLADDVPGNGESWFLARVFDLAARAGIRGVVSFADPEPRLTTQGDVVFPGHVGTIYQASNAVFTGRGTARSLKLLPDGTVLSPRALQKVRAGERGSDGVVRRLVELGARPHQGESRAWLSAALADVGCRNLRHPGNYRYLFTLGTRRERRALTVDIQPLAYPKAA